MKEEPLVSVIIPTYKRPGMLGRAIDSVLNQTYDNIEIIVVDDNDEDSEYRRETEEFIEKYADTDNLVYLKHKRNKGGSAARNTGIKKSKGKFIAFLDDDDEYLEEKIEKQTELLSNTSSDVGLLYSKFIIIDENKNTEIYQEKFSFKSIGFPSRWLVKKKVFNNVVFFDESMPARQDTEMSIRILEIYKTIYDSKVCMKYYVTNNSVSRNFNNMIEALKKLIYKFSNKVTKKELVLWNLNLSSYYFHKKNYLNSIIYLIRSIIIDFYALDLFFNKIKRYYKRK